MRGVYCAAVTLVVCAAQVVSAQVGPDDGGAVLKTPFDIGPAPKSAPKQAGNYVEALINKGKPGPVNETSPYDGHVTASGDRPLPAWEDRPDINKDIQVTPGQGAWMILVQSYTGPESPQLARDLAMHLRQHYKLPAYTFSYGNEERRKEYERVKVVIEKQRDYLKKNHLPLDQPIRVRTMRIEEQVGVLVGGYASEEAARRALNDLRKLPPPDPKKVRLDTKFYVKYERDGKKKETGSATPVEAGAWLAPDLKKVEQQEMVYVNPFRTAFLCRNPAVKQERPADWDKLDMAVLRKLNAPEPYSLLNCKKSVTLVIKQLQTPTTFESKSGGGFLEAVGLVKAKERDDAAATSAHNLADFLRKQLKLEAYVLHTKFASIVTVGSFDGLEDPALRSMQQLLETRLQLPGIGLFPRPLPMQVPR